MKKTLLLCLISLTAYTKTLTVTCPFDTDIQPAIQLAVDQASSYDTIYLPLGSFPLNKRVVINKPVSFIGKGIGKTILYRLESIPDADLRDMEMFYFNINSRVPANIVVKDITFKSKSPVTSLAIDIGVAFIRCNDFTVNKCSFEGFGNSAIYIKHEDDLAGGLIYGNKFIHNYKGVDGMGYGYGVVVYGDNKQWVVDSRFGSDNFVFIEDNTFDGHRHAIAAGGCALYVARYNTIKNNLLNHAIDAHEARCVPGSNYYSTRAVEIYNNTIINTTFKNGTPIIAGGSAKELSEKAIGIRGGQALIYKNTISGYRFGVELLNNYATKDSVYPMKYQMGYLNGDMWIWGNKFVQYVDSKNASSVFYNFQPQYFEESRDYYLIERKGYQRYTYPHPKR